MPPAAKFLCTSACGADAAIFWSLNSRLQTTNQAHIEHAQPARGPCSKAAGNAESEISKASPRPRATLVCAPFGRNFSRDEA